MTFSCSGRPATPPLALILAISICAAASAGASNGAMPFVRSIAAPITIGLPALRSPAAPPTNTESPRASAASATHAVLRVIPISSTRSDTSCLANTTRRCWSHLRLPDLQERLASQPRELVRGEVPERVLVVVAERAVVREDLQVVGAGPARVLERADDRAHPRDPLAGQDAVGPTARLAAPVAHVHAGEARDVGANVVVERLGVPEVPDVEGHAERRLADLVEQFERLRDRSGDGPVAGAEPLHRLQADADARSQRLAADPAQPPRHG